MWHSSKISALGGVCMGALALAACAASPAADQKIAVANASVQRAEQSGAAQAAPVEFAAARDKLTRAQRANAAHDGQPAMALADQAEIDAQVAEATAQQQKSHKAAMEFDASMNALRNETQRSTTPDQ